MKKPLSITVKVLIHRLRRGNLNISIRKEKIILAVFVSCKLQDLFIKLSFSTSAIIN